MNERKCINTSNGANNAPKHQQQTMLLEDIMMLNSLSNEQKIAKLIEHFDSLVDHTEIHNTNNALHWLIVDKGEANVITRPLLSHYINKIGSIDDIIVLEQHASFALDILRHKMAYFPHQTLLVAQLVSKCREENNDFEAAASVLAVIDLDIPGQFSIECKTSVLLRIGELLLDAGDNMNASKYVTRVLRIVNEVKDVTLILRYKVLSARVLDLEQRFLEAAKRYLEISLMNTNNLSQQDKIESLEKSVTCAILAKAGTVRSRVLSVLYADDRAHPLLNFFMLKSMCLERIVTPYEVTKFAEILKPHQKSELAHGKNVLINAVLEHNILAARKLYENILLVHLGSLIGVSADEAERMAAKMIEEDRLNASLDEVDGTLNFNTNSSLNVWNEQIQDFCVSLNNVVESISNTYPQYSL